MSNSSGNWTAVAAPSLNGRKTTLTVRGQVGSGIVGPTLTLCGDDIELPENVIAFDVQHGTGGDPITVTAEADITGRDNLDKVRVLNKSNQHSLLVEITIRRVLS